MLCIHGVNKMFLLYETQRLTEAMYRSPCVIMSLLVHLNMQNIFTLSIGL